MKLEDWTLGNIAVGAMLLVLSWTSYTVQQLAVSTAALSANVEYLVVSNLPARVTELEIYVEQLLLIHERERAYSNGN